MDGERDDNKNTGSLNVNAGIGYHYHFKKDTIIEYLGIDTRYHILNYRNNSGTNLNGNAITLGLIAGINGSY